MIRNEYLTVRIIARLLTLRDTNVLVKVMLLCTAAVLSKHYVAQKPSYPSIFYIG